MGRRAGSACRRRSPPPESHDHECRKPAIPYRVFADLLDLREVEIGGQTYVALSFPGGNHLSGEEFVGQPDLPYLDLWTLLPPQAQMAGVEVISSTAVQIQGHFVPAPIQPPFDPDNPPPVAPPDPEIYNLQTPWPARPGDRAYDGSMRGYFVGRTRIFPTSSRSASPAPPGRSRCWPSW